VTNLYLTEETDSLIEKTTIDSELQEYTKKVIGRTLNNFI
jgi:hypothetical protein